MSGNHATPLNLRMVRTKDEPKRIIGQGEMMCESSFQMACKEIRDVAKEYAQVIQAWTGALKNDSHDMDEREESEDNAELSNEMEVPLSAFVMRCNGIEIIADETRRKQLSW